MLKTRAFWRSCSFLFALITFSAGSTYWLRPWPAVPPPPAAPPLIASKDDSSVIAPPSQPIAVRPVERDLFDEVVEPFVSIAAKSRTDRARRDPAFGNRIDAELNRNRINFLLFGYGETWEPPLPRDIIGTITILSLDVRSRTISQVSLTHDARAPEIERFMEQNGQTPHPSKIDTTYRHGGFDLMRLAVENATGLSIDYQVSTEDTVVKALVDDALGGIEIDNPIALATNPIYINDEQFPCGAFPKGKQTLNGIRTLCYLKGLVLPPYDPAKENNARKPVIYKGLSNALERNLTNPLFPLKMLGMLQQQLDRKKIAYDFDATALVFDSVKHLAAGALSRKVTIPTIDQNVYLVDERIGDGGFSWVMGTQNPIIRDELKRGFYKDTAMVVTSGNPYAADLAKGYWGSVRTIVKSKLMHTAELLLPLPKRPVTGKTHTYPRPY